MYCLVRTATLRRAGDLPVAFQFGTEVTSYLKKTYSVDMKVGVEMYGGCRIIWRYDFDSLDKQQQIMQKLLTDREYAASLNKVKDLWAEGTLKDTLIMFPD